MSSRESINGLIRFALKAVPENPIFPLMVLRVQEDGDDDSRETKAPMEPGVRVVDLLALVIACAVGAMHTRTVIPENQVGDYWIMSSIMILGISLTACGPLLCLCDRLLGQTPRPDGRGSRIGEWIWIVLGLPWLISAAVRVAVPSTTSELSEFASMALFVGLGIACLTTQILIWVAWENRYSEKPWEETWWRGRFGLVLAVAWPVQWALGLMVLTPH